MNEQLPVELAPLIAADNQITLDNGGVWILWHAASNISMHVFNHVSKAHKFLLDWYPNDNVSIETWGPGLLAAFVKGEHNDETYYIEYRKVL